jgi:opacity protein-like surface antigen
MRTSWSGRITAAIAIRNSLMICIVQSVHFGEHIEWGFSRRRSVMRYWLSMLMLVASVGTAHAEMYVAGQAGAAIPDTLSHVEYSMGNQKWTSTDFSQNTSAMYGGKIGYYFDRHRWLGVETEVYRSTPNLPSQVAASGRGPLMISSVDHSIITWSPVTVLVRIPSGIFPVPVEPYAGVGLGVFFSSVSTSSSSSSSTDVGFTSQLGLRYRITPNWAAFGEWKYNSASLSHQNLLGSGVNVNAIYSANLLSFGVSYHFEL